MSAQAGFEVVVDASQKIQHFVPLGHPEETVAPQDMGEHLNGGETMEFRGRQYGLTEHGSLVHAEVEVPEGVRLGAGVLIGQDVEFDMSRDGGQQGRAILIGNQSRVVSSQVHEGVEIGPEVVIIQSLIKAGAHIGKYSRVTFARVGKNARLVEAVKVDKDASIGDDSVLEEAVRVGFNVRVGKNVHIPRGIHAGKPIGAQLTANEKEGIVIRDGARVSERMRKITNDYPAG